MNHLSKVLESHPQPHPHGIDTDKIRQHLTNLSQCAHSCRACADACVAEEEVADLRKCISLNIACAETAQALANLLVQQTDPNKPLLKALVKACEVACRDCAKECEKHASMHTHCDHCRKSCNECESTCQDFANSL